MTSRAFLEYALPVLDNTKLNELNGFVSRWNSRVEDEPKLKLDFTLPSLGVIELLSIPLQTIADLTAAEIAYRRGLVLYATEFVGRCWKSAGIEFRVTDSTSGFILHGRYSGAEFTLNIEEVISDVFLTPNKPVALTADFKRPTLSTHGILTPLILSFCFGVSPEITLDIAEEIKNEWRDKVVAFLGLTCVQYYERTFPKEQFGQVGEIYLAGGIYPLLGMGERTPASLGTKSILRSLLDFGATKLAIIKFAENLALIPDEHLSCIGLSLLGALSVSSPSATIRSVADSKAGRIVSLLHGAIIDAEEIFASSENFVPWHLREEFDVSARMRFDVEKDLNVFPFCVLAAESLTKWHVTPKLRELVIALIISDVERANELCNQLLEEDPKIKELRLQSIYLSIMLKKHEEAENKLRALLSEPGLDEEPRVYSYWGINSMCVGQNTEAARHLEKAYNLASYASPYRASIINDYGWALLQIEDFEKALPLFTECRAAGAAPLTPLLNEALTLKLLGRRTEFAATLKKCRSILPTDQRVFINSYLV